MLQGHAPQPEAKAGLLRVRYKDPGPLFHLRMILKGHLSFPRPPQLPQSSPTAISFHFCFPHSLMCPCWGYSPANLPHAVLSVPITPHPPNRWRKMLWRKVKLRRGKRCRLLMWEECSLQSVTHYIRSLNVNCHYNLNCYYKVGSSWRLHGGRLYLILEGTEGYK